MALRFSLPLSAVLIACTGGGSGAFGGDLTTQDRPPLSNERTGSSTEGVARTNETADKSNERPGVTSNDSSPGGTTGTTPSAFDCTGSYRCTINGAPGDVTITLRFKGTCQTDEGAINDDGTVTKNGQVVATWTPTSNGGFSYTYTSTTKDGTATYTADCQKTSDTAGDDDDDVIQIDAGAPQK